MRTRTSVSFTPPPARRWRQTREAKVVFTLSPDDARHLEPEFRPLTDVHLHGLDLHQVAVRLCQNGRIEPAFTAMTSAAPPSFGDEHGAEIAEASLRSHGQAREAVEAEIHGRLGQLGYRGDFKEIA